MKLGKPIKFVALKPEEVIERVKKNLVVEAKNKSNRLVKLKGDEVLGELNTLFTDGIKYVEHADLSGALKGRQNIYNHLDMLVREAQSTITLVTTSEGLSRKLEVLLPSLEKAKKRGVTVRVAAPIDADNAQVAKDFSSVAEVRSVDGLKGRFMIVDSEQIMFMLLDDEQVHPTYDLGVWINTPFFAQALEQLFEIAWNDMKKV